MSLQLPTAPEVERMITRLQNEPQYGLNPNRVRTKLLGRFQCEARVGPFTFISDEPDERGGRGVGPAPLEYFLAGFAFCQLSIGAAHAALMHLRLDHIEISIRGLVNERGVYGFPGISPAMEDIKYEIRVQSPEPPDRIRAWIQKIEQSCPAYNTLRHPPPLLRTLIVNAEEVPVESEASPA